MKDAELGAKIALAIEVKYGQFFKTLEATNDTVLNSNENLQTEILLLKTAFEDFTSKFDTFKADTNKQLRASSTGSEAHTKQLKRFEQQLKKSSEAVERLEKEIGQARAGEDGKACLSSQLENVATDVDAKLSDLKLQLKCELMDEITKDINTKKLTNEKCMPPNTINTELLSKCKEDVPCGDATATEDSSDGLARPDSNIAASNTAVDAATSKATLHASETRDAKSSDVTAKEDSGDGPARCDSNTAASNTAADEKF